MSKTDVHNSDARPQYVKLMWYQFWCTRCVFRLLKSLFSGTRAEKVGNPRKKCENCIRAGKKQQILCHELCQRILVTCFQTDQENVFRQFVNQVWDLGFLSWTRIKGACIMQARETLRFSTFHDVKTDCNGQEGHDICCNGGVLMTIFKRTRRPQKTTLP
jgi:hypothetical protein